MYFCNPESQSNQAIGAERALARQGKNQLQCSMSRYSNRTHCASADVHVFAYV